MLTPILIILTTICAPFVVLYIIECMAPGKIDSEMVGGVMCSTYNLGIGVLAGWMWWGT